MRTSNIAFAVFAVLTLTIVPLAIADSDAASLNNDVTTFTFKNDEGGTLTFTIDNSGGSRFTADIAVTENGRTVATTSQEIEAKKVVEVSVPMKDFRSVGTHTVVVTVAPASQFSAGLNEFTATIVVEKSLLSNWVTYLVIALVVIVIAVFAILKFRDQPKKKAEMTFEQLEEERKAQMAAKASGEKKAEKKAPSTERQRYLASKNKKE